MLIPNLSPAPFDPCPQQRVLLRVSLPMLSSPWQAPESNATLRVQERQTGVQHMAKLLPLFCSPCLCRDRTGEQWQ